MAVNRFQVDLTHFSEPFDQVAMLPPTTMISNAIVGGFFSLEDMKWLLNVNSLAAHKDNLHIFSSLTPLQMSLHSPAQD